MKVWPCRTRSEKKSDLDECVSERIRLEERNVKAFLFRSRKQSRERVIMDEHVAERICSEKRSSSGFGNLKSPFCFG